MRAFAMCEACREEYEDPSDRRFHAQPIACNDCGPKLSISIDEMAAVLSAGCILALKGLGGYHLVCDARIERVVSQLRARKKRDAFGSHSVAPPGSGEPRPSMWKYGTPYCGVLSSRWCR